MAIGAGEKARLHVAAEPVGRRAHRDDRGVVVGEGHTQAPGESHAEIEALRRAGERRAVRRWS